MNPMTWHTDGLRYATVGAGALGNVILEGLGFGIFLILSFLAAVQTLHKGILR